MKNLFVEELKWRGMIHDIMPETEYHLNKEKTSGYIGFDPTSDSLHIGSLVQIIILMHFQKHGYTPIVLIGGATGMIGDPSGKSEERNLLDSETLEKNISGIKKQLMKFLNFENKANNSAKLLNNLEWTQKYSMIDFSREIGKHIPVNYMMSKDSVKKRIFGDSKKGMSFTEFTYQLLQAFDFLFLYKNHNCTIQMGGSDQWGNITTGTELIRRKINSKAFAITCPLLTNSDGSKFGKTEGGNIWLDKNKTSTYKFYQYWLNCSDIDAEKYIKIFTFLDKDEIEKLISEHKKNPHLRELQKRVAEEVTILVHSKLDLENAKKASEILFGKSTRDDLIDLDEKIFKEIFEGVPSKKISNQEISQGIEMVSLLSSKTNFLNSNGEVRRAIKENSISINKLKVDINYKVNSNDLINGKYILIQKGKKNYFVIESFS